MSSIIALKEAEGSSRQAITKYIKSNFQKDDASALRRALKKGVADGKLVQAGARFKVKGVEFEAAAQPKVTIKDLVEGEGPAAGSGDTVVMKYRGKLDDGSIFDQGSKFAFQIDAGEVIKGWDQGIKGSAYFELTLPPDFLCFCFKLTEISSWLPLCAPPCSEEGRKAEATCACIPRLRQTRSSPGDTAE